MTHTYALAPKSSQPNYAGLKKFLGEQKFLVEERQGLILITLQTLQASDATFMASLYTNIPMYGYNMTRDE